MTPTVPTTEQPGLPADPLLQPFKLKRLVLKNRIMSTSHAFSYEEGGKPTERYQRYHEEKAKGGIALTMFGGSSNVAADSASIFGQLYVGDDSIIPYFEQIAERVHRHGAALMCQITHLGGRTHWRADNWLPVLAPSRFREPLHRAISREMDRHDIDRIVKAFGAAARRCKDGGLDGVEVNAHGHLVGQFWSPDINHRSDEFGGSLENRCRFGLMVFEEIRRQVGGDFVVGLRMQIDEGSEGSLGEDDCRDIALLHERSGLVDFLNLNHGRIDTEIGLASYMPGMVSGLAPFLERVGRFRKGLASPVFHACRITELATARYAIRNELIDMVGMTRAHIADPHIVRKLMQGDESRIRPCVGATYCSWQRLCIHNPASGREQTLPHEIAPAPERRKVVVVGAGPAGLEAARVSALRGHDVVLFEASARPGGQVLLAARVRSRRDLIGIVDWRASEAERAGVTFRMNALADATMVLAEDPDVVICATGGLPDMPLPEGGSESVVSTWDVLSGAVAPSGTVLVFDGTGVVNAPTCAEVLIERGARIIYVTRDHHAAKETSHLETPFLLRTLYMGGAVMLPDRALLAVERANGKTFATLRNELTGEREEQSCDLVVVEHGTIPSDDLHQSLRSKSRNNGNIDLDALVDGRAQARSANPEARFDLFSVGDAVASRDIHAAILDSLRLCKDL